MDVSRSRIFIGFKYSDNLTTAVNLYKQIFLLVGQINFCFCQIVLPAILIYGICINILGTYLSVKLNSKLFTNVGSLLYPVLAFETLLLIIGMGMTAGIINKTSMLIASKMKVAIFDVVMQRGKTRVYKIFVRRMINACGPMKIRFGSNFIDISTPLVMTCFCMKTLVRLLLLF